MNARKLHIVAALCLLVVSIPVMAANSVSQAENGYHPIDTLLNSHATVQNANWSIIPYVGFNVFDGDFSKPRRKHAVDVPTVGLGVEYSFSPVWAIGAEYKFDRYGVRGNVDEGFADTLLSGYMHRADAYLSADLMGLFFPHDKRKICSIELLAGGGYAWFKNKVQYDDNGTFSAMDKYDGSAYVMGGANVEFNLNRTLALGLRADYAYFMRDHLDGHGFEGSGDKKSKNNDGIFDVMLNMRIKFGGTRKSHVRNIGGSESNILIAQYLAHPEYVHDTVIIYRDTVIIREETRIHREKSPAQTYYVYFESGKTQIDDNGLVTIHQVAERMAEDESLYAVVIGYCDNTGSDQTNYVLGDQRAEAVVDELHAEHNVPSNHLYGAGEGKIKGNRSASYGPNRRAAIKLVDEETFDLLVLEMEDRKVSRAEDVKTLPLSETARRAKVNAYKERPCGEVTVDRNTTLAKLARQYYNNTYCWVYIYMANREIITDPSALPVGATLKIPELTGQETSIGKDESLSLYRMARSLK